MKYSFSLIFIIAIYSTIVAQLPNEAPKKFDKRCLIIDSLDTEANKGDVYAMYLLAGHYDTIFNRMLFTGYIPPDCGSHKSGVYWYTKAAEKGDIASMVNLGDNYEYRLAGVFIKITFYNQVNT